MICEFKVDGEIKRFRVSHVYNYKTGNYDKELTCINEERCLEFHGKIIPHEKFKNSWRENKIKVII